MALFFIVSGFCLKEKYFEAPFLFVWKRITGLWWPFVKWCLIFLFFHNLFHDIGIYSDTIGYLGNGVHKYSSPETFERAKNIVFRMEGIEPLLGGFWFIRSLFYGSVFVFITILVLRKGFAYFKLERGWIPIIGGGVFLLFSLLSSVRHNTLTVFHFSSNTFLASAFFCMGYILVSHRARKFPIWIIMIVLITMVISAPYIGIAMADSFYEPSHILPYYFEASAIVWSLYSFPWRKLNKSFLRVLEYMGNNTLPILTWHFLSFKLVTLLIIEYYGLCNDRMAEFPVIYEYANQGWFVAYFIVGVAIPILINSAFRRIWLYIKKFLCITH